MATKAPSAVGVFDELEQARKPSTILRQAGFPAEEIGVIGHVGTEQQTIPTPLEVMPGEEKRDARHAARRRLGRHCGHRGHSRQFQAWPGPPARACGSRSWAAPS